MRRPALVTVCFLMLVLGEACKHEPANLLTPPIVTPPSDFGNFPEEVAAIFSTKCATAGCHNALSYTGASGLRLDNWEHIFAGAENGATVIPYSPKYSSMLYFTNIDPTLGVVAEPTMPKDAPPLSTAEYLTLKNWIADGAPDKNGNVAFSSNKSGRQKIYMTQQACDLIAVIDGEKKMAMRYIEVGMKQNDTEAPHNIRFSPDGRYAYVCFSSGDYMQKIDASEDTVIASVNLNVLNSSTSFNVLIVSPKGDEILVSNWVHGGGVVLVDANSMTVKKVFNVDFGKPHGLGANASFDTFFVTGEGSGGITRISKDGKHIKKIPLGSTTAPHDIVMAPDYSKYFVACQGTDEVVVIDAHTDAIIKRIPVGQFPQELAISPTTSKVFVTCMNDKSTTPGKFQGSVHVIDYSNNDFKVLDPIHGKFSQPHGLSIDEINGFIYVASRNVDGPPPHHPSSCGGKNGYYQVFDLYTHRPFTGTDRRYEVNADPYSLATRFVSPN